VAEGWEDREMRGEILGKIGVVVVVLAIMVPPNQCVLANCACGGSMKVFLPLSGLISSSPLLGCVKCVEAWVEV
jgi:hypothetical protein